jgi:hypothetical protein
MAGLGGLRAAGPCGVHLGRPASMKAAGAWAGLPAPLPGMDQAGMGKSQLEAGYGASGTCRVLANWRRGGGEAGSRDQVWPASKLGSALGRPWADSRPPGGVPKGGKAGRIQLRSPLPGAIKFGSDRDYQSQG